jgi:hypothetical protein
VKIVSLNIGIDGFREAPASPWQNGVAERWIGSCRREFLDHLIVLNEAHLRRLIWQYISYYHADRNPRLSWERHSGDTTCFLQTDPICVFGFTQGHRWLASPIRLAAGCLKKSFVTELFELARIRDSRWDSHSKFLPDRCSRVFSTSNPGDSSGRSSRIPGAIVF